MTTETWSADADDPQSSPRCIALVALHAGYSHSSPALQSIRAYCADEPFHGHIRLFESLVNVSHQQLLEQLLAARPSIVGFSTYLWNIQAAIRLVQVLKQLLPDCVTVFGGPEAGPRGEALLRDLPSLDYVVEGEGEAAFRDLVRWTQQGEGQPEAISGLRYRSDGTIRANPVAALPVEAIPSPLLAGSGAFDKPLVYWETSRGCPFRCSFCGSATERLRAFPLPRIEAELAVLARLQNKTVKLLDRSFHLGRERTRHLLERFAATPPGLRFHLELNPDRISDDAMEIFRRAEPGKFQFEIGLQTLSEPVLDAIDRQMEIPRALENIRRLVAMHRHPVHLDLIVGLPGEDAAHCADSLDRVFALYPDHLQLGTLKLLPGTPLLVQAQTFGYRWDPEPPYEVLAHPLMGFQEIGRFKRYAALLERLWNSGYLRNTLAALVEREFSGRLSACFDAMMDELGEGVARDNLQPDSLFERVSRFVAIRADRHPVLVELLLWDYAHYSLLTGKTPRWIAERLEGCDRLSVDGTRRRLPVLPLSEAAVAVIDRLTMASMRTGRYAVWPRQHSKGKPVEIVAVEG